jgi:hypothetical protein
MFDENFVSLTLLNHGSSIAAWASKFEENNYLKFTKQTTIERMAPDQEQHCVNS